MSSSGLSRLGISVDQLNIGLLFLSGAVALVIPFPLLLFSYAVLGPLHYLTEISWLQQKRFFTTNKHDYLWLSLTAIVYILVLSFSNSAELIQIPFVLLFGAAIAAFVKKLAWKVIAIIGVAVLSPFVMIIPSMYVLIAILVPTAIHVYIFTGLFMLQGALRSKSRDGLIAFFLLLTIGGLLLALPVPMLHMLSEPAINSNTFFSEVHNIIADGLHGVFPFFESGFGLQVWRFLAFAYTYHYLNWFSKTSIIQWNKMSRPRAVFIVFMWVCSIGLYLYNYALGLQALLILSFLHVILEYPLNFKSIQGIMNHFLKPKAK